MTPSATQSYISYLNSKKWVSRRKRFHRRCIKMHGKLRCFFCRSEEDLHVHHYTYKHLGYEKNHDLSIACSKCHEAIHYFYKNINDYQRLSLKKTSQLYKRIIRRFSSDCFSLKNSSLSKPERMLSRDKTGYNLTPSTKIQS